MPTEAVTGTHNLTTGGVEHAPHDNPTQNGTVQVIAEDGATYNIDASQEGWEDKVREIDPKHPLLKYAAASTTPLDEMSEIKAVQRPPVNALKSVWVEYATSLGLEDVDELTKEELIDLCDQNE